MMYAWAKDMMKVIKDLDLGFTPKDFGPDWMGSEDGLLVGKTIANTIRKAFLKVNGNYVVVDYGTNKTVCPYSMHGIFDKGIEFEPYYDDKSLVVMRWFNDEEDVCYRGDLDE